jgi:hypothetical protein
VRLDLTAGRGPVVARVVEAQPVFGADRRGDRDHHVGVDLRAGARYGECRGLHRAHPVAQARRQHLLELGEGPDRGLADALDTSVGRGTQADRDRDRFLVVQQQRRQRGAGPQSIATGHPGRRLHGVAELPQPVDVGADRAGGHVQPLGQFGPRPQGAGLEQGEQTEQPGRSVQHLSRMADIAEESLPQ